MRAYANRTRNYSRLGIKSSSLYFLNDISNINNTQNTSEENPSNDWRDLYTMNTDLLGRGHFSKVYKAKSTENGNSVAIKVIRRRRRGVDMYDQIIKEIDMMDMFHKSNIGGFLRLIDYHVTKMDIAIVLELATGGSVYDVVYTSKTGLPEAYCKIIMAKIMTALNYIHNQQIVHLDIKADNILLRHPYPSSDAVICDFGVARKLDQNVSHKEFVGTPDYIAPEIANYDEISCKTDIWSMGVLCYFILTNVSPFLCLSKEETMKNVSSAKFEFLGNLRLENLHQARSFITLLLKKLSKDRPSASECLQHEFLANVSIISSEPSYEEPVTTTEAPQSPASPVRVRNPSTSTCMHRQQMAVSQYEIHSCHQEHALKTDNTIPFDIKQPEPQQQQQHNLYNKPCSMLNLETTGITDSSSSEVQNNKKVQDDKQLTDDEISASVEFQEHILTNNNEDNIFESLFIKSDITTDENLQPELSISEEKELNITTEPDITKEEHVKPELSISEEKELNITKEPDITKEEYVKPELSISEEKELNISTEHNDDKIITEKGDEEDKIDILRKENDNVEESIILALEIGPNLENQLKRPTELDIDECSVAIETETPNRNSSYSIHISSLTADEEIEGLSTTTDLITNQTSSTTATTTASTTTTATTATTSTTEGTTTTTTTTDKSTTDSSDHEIEDFKHDEEEASKENKVPFIIKTQIRESRRRLSIKKDINYRTSISNNIEIATLPNRIHAPPYSTSDKNSSTDEAISSTTNSSNHPSMVRKRSIKAGHLRKNLDMPYKNRLSQLFDNNITQAPPEEMTSSSSGPPNAAPNLTKAKWKSQPIVYQTGTKTNNIENPDSPEESSQKINNNRFKDGLHRIRQSFGKKKKRINNGVVPENHHNSSQQDNKSNSGCIIS